jgi:hypothetical protein
MGCPLFSLQGQSKVEEAIRLRDAVSEAFRYTQSVCWSSTLTTWWNVRIRPFYFVFYLISVVGLLRWISPSSYSSSNSLLFPSAHFVRRARISRSKRHTCWTLLWPPSVSIPCSICFFVHKPHVFSSTYERIVFSNNVVEFIAICLTVCIAFSSLSLFKFGVPSFSPHWLSIAQHTSKFFHMLVSCCWLQWSSTETDEEMPSLEPLDRSRRAWRYCAVPFHHCWFVPFFVLHIQHLFRSFLRNFCCVLH